MNEIPSFNHITLVKMGWMGFFRLVTLIKNLEFKITSNKGCTGVTSTPPTLISSLEFDYSSLLGT